MDHILRNHAQAHGLVGRDVNSLISRTPFGCSIFHIHCLATTLISSAFLGGVSAESWLAAAHQKMNRNRNERGAGPTDLDLALNEFRHRPALCTRAAAVAQ